MFKDSPKITVVCLACGKEEQVNPSRACKYKTCSMKCLGAYNRAEDNCTCPVCGKTFHRKPFHLTQVKGEACCSRECLAIVKKEVMSGVKNHQFGLKGELNASFKSDFKISNYGYLMQRCLNHPFRDCDGFVRVHRMIAEKHLLNDFNSVEVDGAKYLSAKFDVHHLDGNKLNNELSNLIILTRSEHASLHAKQRRSKLQKNTL